MMAITSDHQVEYGGLTMGRGTDYPIDDADGLDMPTVRDFDHAVTGRHGEFPGRDLLGSRIVTLSVIPAGTDEMAALNTAFRPCRDEQPLTFRIPGVAGGGVRRIMARPRRASVPVTIDHSLGLPLTVLQLKATDPRIYDENESSTSVGLPATVSGLSWPLTWPLTWGTVSSDSVNAANTGNFAAPVRFRIDGPIVGPEIQNGGTGDTLEFSTTLGAGEWLLVDTANHTVLLNGDPTLNRYSDIRLGSRWFDLEPGVTNLRLRALYAGPGAQLTATWRSAWIA